MPESREFRFDAATGRLLHEDANRVQTIYLPWPSPTAMQRDGSGGPWRAVRPPLDLQRAGDPALARYVEAIPAEVRAIVRRFPDRHWDLVRLAASGGEPATDLLESNPALGYMVAANDEFRRVHHTDAATVARMLLAPRRRQRDVLAWLRFPPGDAVRRIVRKIGHDAISVRRLLGLRERIGEDGCQHRLAHLPRIPEPVLALACERLLDRVSPALLRALADGRVADGGAVPQLVADAVRMWRMARPRAEVPAFGGAVRLRQEHDRLARTADWLKVTGRASNGFPDPPLAGTSDIVPLTSAQALAEEGLVQRNCVGSYAPSVRRRALFVYRVLAPSRATLSIVRVRGRWDIDQLEAGGNRRVPEATLAAVREWLRASQAPPRVDPGAPLVFAPPLPTRELAPPDEFELRP